MTESNILEIGSTVRYRAEFLRSIGEYTGNMPFARGKVLKLQALGEILLAVLSWNCDDMPEKVDVKNLERF